MWGPTLYCALIQKIYRPSQSKIRDLKEKLESLDLKTYPAENVTLYVQDATKIIREIRINFMKPDEVPDLLTAALTGLISCSDECIRRKARDLRIDSDVLGSTQPDPITVLQSLDDLYRVLVNQKDYGPAISPAAHSKFKAMIGEMVDVKFGTLIQDRSAGGKGGGAGTDGVCWDCGLTGHRRGTPACPKPGSLQFKPGNPPNASPASGGSTGGGGTPGVGRPATHGLDDATNLKVMELIKAKLPSLPPRAHIPDTAEHSITLDGTIIAKYCRHCGRFAKGKNAHFTAEHKGTRNTFAYNPSAPVPPPPPASAPGPPPTAAGQLAAVDPSPTQSVSFPDAPIIDTNVFMHPETNYDFGSMPTSFAANLASLDPDSEDFQRLLLKIFSG